jgi:hypothetical protein
MAKIPIPFSAADITTVARSLHQQLGAAGHTPGHLELLHMLARSAGFRNYQALRAQAAAQRQLDSAAPAPAPVDYVQVRRVARYFDSAGRLTAWPAKAGLQKACLWALWSRLKTGHSFTEAELNQEIRNLHLFGDHALLRRELCDQGMVKRTADGKSYRRVEQAPSPEGLALIHHLSRAAASETRSRSDQ